MSIKPGTLEREFRRRNSTEVRNSSAFRRALGCYSFHPGCLRKNQLLSDHLLRLQGQRSSTPGDAETIPFWLPPWRVPGCGSSLQGQPHALRCPYPGERRRSSRLSSDKVYTTDVRGFLVDPDTWDENFAVHRAMESKIPAGQLTERHWQIIYYLRDVHQLKHRIPNIYETCESCDLDLDTFEQLFPDGYHRGSSEGCWLRFAK